MPEPFDTACNVITRQQMMTINRLVIQRLMVSSLFEYVEYSQRILLNDRFLSENPDIDVTLTVINPEERNFYNVVATLSLRWRQETDEVMDESGDLWSKFSLAVSPAIYSMATSDDRRDLTNNFFKRVVIINSLHEFVNEVIEMAPQPVKILTCTSKERIVRERKIRDMQVISLFVNALRTTHASLCRRMRAGGKSKNVPRDLIHGLSPGIHEVTVTRQAWRRRVYSLEVPANGKDQPVMRRLK